MRVLVTGASGFLGSHVAEQLKKRGDEVVCLVRKTSDTSFLRELGVELAEGAVDDASTLPKAVEGAQAIIHCAGLVKARSMAEFDRVHEGGTVALARAALETKAPLRRFVHVSTAGVMGLGGKGKKHMLGDEPAPVTSYGKSKLTAERALLAFTAELPITIIRPPAIYGPRDREILAFFQMVRRTRMAFRLGHSMKSVSMIYATDCARACIAAIDAAVPSGSTYFVDDGYAYTYEDMAHAIAAGYGVGLLGTPSVPVPLVTAAAAGAELFGRVANRTMMFTRDKLPELLAEYFVVDGAPARKDLGWEPVVPFAEGAKLTATWYRENRWD
ncbi:MAG: NAD-dependent epimerase/dehydratase family protein [Polyangiaceae bacterium]|nr:NAD-dependent epimerase/dehydratase family protein [Polyangiaceae bacterium]